MLTTVVPRIMVKQVVLASTGLLSSGTITPSSPAGADKIPNRIVAADIYNVASWAYSDLPSGVFFPIGGGQIYQLPGSFVKDIYFTAGTYIITFYLDA